MIAATLPTTVRLDPAGSCPDRVHLQPPNPQHPQGLTPPWTLPAADVTPRSSTEGPDRHAS